MKKTLAVGIAAATAALSSCTMPWSKESPADLPPPIAPANVQGPVEVANQNGEQPAPASNGSGIVEPGVPVVAGPNAMPPAPAANAGTGKQAMLSGAAEDPDVKEAMGEIDKLFDGIAGDTGSTKK